MTTQADITVFDGAATPVSHTFYAANVSKEKGVVTAWWKEAVTTVPDIAQGTIAMSMKMMGNGIVRVNSRVSIPVMESITGQNSSGYTAPPKVAYVDTVDIVGYFSQRGTVLGRRLARQLALNVASNVSTSVAASTAGPVADMFDKLIMVG